MLIKDANLTVETFLSLIKDLQKKVLAAPSYELSNQFFKILIDLKNKLKCFSNIIIDI